MRGDELVRKLKKLAKKRGWGEVRVDMTRGKGDHFFLWLGDNFAPVPGLREEIKRKTLRSILRDLGLTEGDLR